MLIVSMQVHSNKHNINYANLIKYETNSNSAIEAALKRQYCHYSGSSQFSGGSIIIKQVQISYKELYRSVVFQLGCVQC